MAHMIHIVYNFFKYSNWQQAVSVRSHVVLSVAIEQSVYKCVPVDLCTYVGKFYWDIQWRPLWQEQFSCNEQEIWNVFNVNYTD